MVSSEWEVKRLIEVAEIYNGGTPDTKIKQFWDGEYLWLTPKDMGRLNSIYVDDTERKITEEGMKNSSAKMVPLNSIILSSRAPIGHLAINKKPMSFNQGCKGIVPRKNLTTKFLYYFLTDSVGLLNELGTGTTFKELSTGKLAQIKLPLPPLAEQKRIVEILDEAFAAIDKAKANVQKNLQSAKELFESYMQTVIGNGIGWEEKFLEDVVDSQCTLSYGIVQPGDEYPNGLPIVRPTDLTQKFINLEGLKLIDSSLARSYKKTTLRGNELLLCVRGSTGTISISTKELAGANVTRGIVPIVFNDGILNLEFGYYLFISPYVQKQIKEKTYGAALMQINIGDVRKIKIIVPSVKEQRNIVRMFNELYSSTKSLENKYQRKLKDLEELKKSILQKAFTGELTQEIQFGQSNVSHEVQLV